MHTSTRAAKDITPFMRNAPFSPQYFKPELYAKGITTIPIPSPKKAMPLATPKLSLKKYTQQVVPEVKVCQFPIVINKFRLLT